MLEKKRALITGINGFTGHYVADELRNAGYAVFGTGSNAADLPDYFQVDLLDKKALADVINQVQPTVVVHLAAIAYVGHGAASDFYRVNLIGTHNLLETLSTCSKRLEVVLLASSANVYGNSVEGCLSENTIPNPANDYAVSKLAMEHMARLWFDKLPIFIVRPFNYTGVGQSESFLLPKIVSHFRSRASVIELGNIDVWRDFSDVRNVVYAYRKLLEVKPVGQCINICSGTTYSLREILLMAEKITHHHIEIRVNPAFVRANEVKTLSGDNRHLRALIGDLPFTELLDTLRWMIGSDV